jgi:hypothetical protein
MHFFYLNGLGREHPVVVCRPISSASYSFGDQLKSAKIQNFAHLEDIEFLFFIRY